MANFCTTILRQCRLYRWLYASIVLFLGFVGAISDDKDKDLPASISSSRHQVILHVQCNADLDSDYLRHFSSLLKIAKNFRNDVHSILLEVHTSTGSISVAKRFAELLLEIDRPIIVYINTTAIGPSALFSFIGERLYLAPHGLVGNIILPPPTPPTKEENPSLPEPEINIEVLRALIRNYAQRFGYRSEVGEAMVDPMIEKTWKGKKIEKGRLLVLTTQECLTIQEDQKPLHGHKILPNRDAVIQEIQSEYRFKGPLVSIEEWAREKNRQASLSANRIQPTPIENNKSQLLILDIKGEFNQPLLYYLRRGFKIAERNKQIGAVIVRMDTPGGQINIMKEIIGLVSNCNLPIILYVEQHAYSAGAITSFAFKEIYMREGSVIGAAAPILVTPGGPSGIPEYMEEKVLSAIRAMVRALAEKNGHRPAVGEAMIDANIELRIGGEIICPKGKLLTLTAHQAAEIMPDGKPLHATAMVSSLQEILDRKGWNNLNLITLEPKPAEKIAEFIIYISPILLLLGFLGIYIEIKTPGFGFPGFLGICCFAILFFGHYIAHLAGYEELILLFCGLILLLIEIFLLPGFGFTGALGILCMIVAFFMMAIPGLPTVPGIPGLDTWSLLSGYFSSILYTFLLFIIAIFMAFWIGKRFFPHTKLYHSIILDHSQTSEGGYNATMEKEQKKLEGKTGVAHTALRPSGIAIIENQRVDVVTEGIHVEKGTPIQVVRVVGSRVIVQPTNSSSPKE